MILEKENILLFKNYHGVHVYLLVNEKALVFKFYQNGKHKFKFVTHLN